MKGNTKRLIFSLSLATSTMLLSISPIANAGGPIALSDGQLDRLTAGAAVVFANSGGLATGLITGATSAANTIYGSTQGVEDGFGSEGGLAVGTAVTFTAGQAQGAPPSTSSTNVSTGGAAEGNFTMSFSGGGKVTAAGLTIQSGFTAVYGAFIPGL